MNWKTQFRQIHWDEFIDIWSTVKSMRHSPYHFAKADQSLRRILSKAVLRLGWKLISIERELLELFIFQYFIFIRGEGNKFFIVHVTRTVVLWAYYSCTRQRKLLSLIFGIVRYSTVQICKQNKHCTVKNGDHLTSIVWANKLYLTYFAGWYCKTIVSKHYRLKI